MIFKRVPLWAVVAFVFGSAVFSFWLNNAARWPDYRELAKKGRAATGWVTAKGLNGSRKVNYSFAANGRIYSGEGRAGFGTPRFKDISKGDEALIFYLPQKPEISVLGDPQAHLRQQNRLLAFLFTLIAVLAFFALRRELRRGEGGDERFKERQF